MNLLNMKSSGSQNLKDGLEYLGKVYKPRVRKGKATVLAGIDGGSTSSRTLILDSKDLSSNDLSSLTKVWTIPSTHSRIKSFEEVLPQNEVLYQNMDAWINNNKNDGTAIFDKVRILRGTKFSDANFGAVRINSSIQKIDTEAFYINIIDSIAYSLLMKYEELCEEYDVYLGVSLRPDDINNTKNREKFLGRMRGSYNWENADLNVSIKINIKDIEVQTEPEAQQKAYCAYNDIEVPECMLLLETGGSSCGVSIIKDNVRVKSADATFAYGGTQLKQEVNRLYMEQNGKGLTDEQLQSALEIGTYKLGRGVIDMVPFVMEAKNNFAKKIFADLIKEVFDKQSEVSIESIESFYFGGKAFRTGEFCIDENSTEATGYSLAEPLTKELMTLNPNAEYTVLDDNYIPLGNVLNALESFSGYIVEKDGEEVSITETNIEQEDTPLESETLE